MFINHTKHKAASYRNKLCMLISACSLLLAVSCKTEHLVPNTKEAVKDINGTWSITSATLNGSELLSLPDAMTHLSAFNITFADGKYTLSNPVPFIVSTDGEYVFNDPQYPLDITFKATGAAKEAKSSFLFPVVEGKRRITLTFSPGCDRNIYKYTFKKIN